MHHLGAFLSSYPSPTPLVYTRSLYHEKVIAGELDWDSMGCYCMRIDYEKYGSSALVICMALLMAYMSKMGHVYDFVLLN